MNGAGGMLGNARGGERMGEDGEGGRRWGEEDNLGATATQLTAAPLRRPLVSGHPRAIRRGFAEHAAEVRRPLAAPGLQQLQT